jgi:chromosome segregation ATPase
MKVFKDQAEKLRILAQRGHKEEVLRLSDIVGATQPEHKMRFSIVKAVNIALIVLVLAGLAGFSFVIAVLNTKSGALKGEISSLNAKMEIVGQKLAMNNLHNQKLERQQEDLEFKRLGLEEKLAGAEKEKSALSEALLLSNKKVQELEASKDTASEALLLSNKKVQELEASKDTAEHRMQQGLAELQSKIEQLSSRLESAIAVKQTVVASKDGAVEGRVILINREFQFAVVNLGKEESIDKNMRLEVIENNQVIAEIKVLEARKSVSACDISGFSDILKVGDTVRVKI